MADLLLSTDTLAQGYPKINIGITQAEQALSNSESAIDTANSALNISNTALEQSENTQTQLDTIVVEGDSSVEAAQARVNTGGTVTYATLKQRLDTEHTDVISKQGDLSSLPTNTKDNLVNVWVKNYNRINPEDYGAVLDGNADDTDKIQASVNAAIAKKKEWFLPPQANAKVTGTINVNNNIKMVGGGSYSSYILCVGCDGFNIATPTLVNMEGFSIAQSVRHTTTANTKKGIIINGDTTNRPYNHTYKDIYIDGFETAIEANWIWASLFNSIRTNYGKKGLVIKGLSVNNKINGNSQFIVDGSSGSRGIVLGDGINELEGWWINSPLTFGAEIGIQGVGASHIYISKPILDFCKVLGIQIKDNGTDFGGNWEISGGYIAMTGTSGDAAIKDSNTIANNNNKGSIIRGVKQLVYSGSSCNYGTFIENANSKNNIIESNNIYGFAVHDIYTPNSENTVRGNVCTSPVTYNINTKGILGDNVGKEYYRRAENYIKVGSMKWTWDEAAPTTGTWSAGDRCIKINPVVGTPKGWSCSNGGTPGTWESEGNL